MHFADRLFGLRTFDLHFADRLFGLRTFDLHFADRFSWRYNFWSACCRSICWLCSFDWNFADRFSWLCVFQSIFAKQIDLFLTQMPLHTRQDILYLAISYINFFAYVLLIEIYYMRHSCTFFRPRLNSDVFLVACPLFFSKPLIITGFVGYLLVELWGHLVAEIVVPRL